MEYDWGYGGLWKTQEFSFDLIGNISCCICENCSNDFNGKFQWKKLDGWDIDFPNEGPI